MSRSYRKTAASPICSSRGDKEDRSIYHRAERRKTNLLLNRVVSEWVSEQSINFSTCYSEIDSIKWEITADKIVVNTIDYSLPDADKWSWGSDGGSYWSSDKSEMRMEFDKVVFGIPYYSFRWIYQSFSKNEAWNDYLRYREAAQNKKHSYYKWRTLWNGEKWLQHVRGPKQADSDWNIMEMLFYRKVIPFSFWGPEDFIAWMRAHEEEIIELALKMRYKRK